MNWKTILAAGAILFSGTLFAQTINITCLTPNGGFTIDGENYTILTQGQSADFSVQPQGSTVELWSCGALCRDRSYDVLPGSVWNIFDEGAEGIGLQEVLGPECDYHMGVNCPPSDDPQTYINGLDVQLNGGFGASPEQCWATHFSWDWGDGSSNDSYFPASHTYPSQGDYTVTVSAFDGGNWLIDATCDLTTGVAPFTCVGFYVPFDVPMMVATKSKRALPLKFNLFDEYGNEVTDLSPPPIVEVKVLPHTGSSIPGWDGELLPPGLSDDGNEFRYDLDSGKWILNLGMKTYTASTTYVISVLAGDSSYAIEGCTESFTRQ